MQGIRLDAPFCDQSRGQMQIRWVITRLPGSRRERPVEAVAKGSTTRFLLRIGLIYINRIMWLKI